eukprot:1647414-Pleurochrysis_carterae.AAC.1
MEGTPYLIPFEKVECCGGNVPPGSTLRSCFRKALSATTSRTPGQVHSAVGAALRNAQQEQQQRLAIVNVDSASVPSESASEQEGRPTT